MKFWLTCFVLLFAGAELFEWIVKIGAQGLSAAWLVLGGMALATVSNAKHLPRLGTEVSSNVQQPPSSELGRANDSDVPTGQSPTSIAKASAEDTISFKVRLPWQ